MINKDFQLLSRKWKFQKVGDDKWYDATVPGCVHQDLLLNDLIPDPFVGCNEKKLQWIMENQWTYYLLFDPAKEWSFSKENNLSLSENTPLIETKLVGKVIGTIIKNKYHSNI